MGDGGKQAPRRLLGDAAEANTQGEVTPQKDGPPGHAREERAEALSAELDRTQSLSDADQTEADSDQTAADADEAASASDEASSYSDQQGSDRDQAAADADQAVADRDETTGPHTERTTELYEDSRSTRSYSADTRLAATAQRSAAQSERSRQELAREQTARRRDETAALRDRVAEQRDRAASLADRRALTSESVAVTDALQQVLKSSAAVREQAAADRARAADDRVRAAVDRQHAAEHRRQARIAVQRAQLDSLTGVFMRDLGRETLQHEIDRCRRSGEPFVLGFMDVDGLKALNDAEGHAAGDALLQAVVAALKAKLRSYDPIVRVGGDEFLCGFVSAKLGAAERRAREISDAVRDGSPAGTVSIGLAELRDRDTLESLTARADADMYARKSRVSGARP